MIELYDSEKLHQTPYREINIELQECLVQLRQATELPGLAMGCHYDFDYAFIISRIQHFEGKRFLDLGGGLSTLPIFIAQRGGIATVVDQNLALAHCYKQIQAKLNLSINFIQGDFCSIQLPPTDTIVACSSIEHNSFDKAKTLFQHLGTCLAEGSEVIFTAISCLPSLRSQCHPYSFYSPSTIEKLTGAWFELETQDSNFQQLETLYTRFHQKYPSLYYIPLGISLRKKHKR